MKNKVFSTLKVFGFNDTDDIEIYKKEEEKKQIKKKKPEPVVTGEVDINSLMYLKNIKCPVGVGSPYKPRLFATPVALCCGFAACGQRGTGAGADS